MADTVNQKSFRHYHALHQSALKIAKELANQEFLMIEALQKIDHEKVYRFIGFKSLFQYAVSGLKLAENRAYNFILVARKAAEIEALQNALKSNEITLSKAKRIAAVIKPENAEEWLTRSKTLSQRMLERAVAKVDPRSQVEEGTRFISSDTLELKAAISLDTEKLIKRTQDLLCQSRGGPVSLDETLQAMAKIFLEKKDPVIKADRALKKAMRRQAKNKVKPPQESDSSETGATQDVTTLDKSQKTGLEDQPFSVREPLPASMKHQVFARDQGRCQAIEADGTVCSSERWIDIHHRVHVSQGGPNTIENLLTLCRAHHQMEHDIRQ